MSTAQTATRSIPDLRIAGPEVIDPAFPYPEWSRRSNRAVPTIDAPRLSQAERAAVGNERRLGRLLIVRAVAAFAALAYAIVAGWWVAVAVLSYLAYSSALTVVHHLVHTSLGLAPRARRFWLSAIAALLGESGHALQTTHLLHHRGDDRLPDPEGYIENVSWRQMPLAALSYRYRLMWWGLTYSPRRRRIALELGLHAALHIGSLALLPFTVIPWIFVTLMDVTSIGFAVFSGKGPHANFGRPVDSPFVRVRSRIARVLFMSHDRHLEHHVYPKVPLPFLHRVDARIAAALEPHRIVDVELAI